MVDRDIKVFVFGAGASHGARTPSPPLGKDLHQYVLKYLWSTWRERHHLEEDDYPTTETVRLELRDHLTSRKSFESLVRHLLGMPREWRRLHQVNFLMACALTPPFNDESMADAFVEKVDLYDRFLAVACPNLGKCHNATFISFNYDCLLERAICRRVGVKPLEGERQCLCRHVDYRLKDDLSGIEVLKPHGSINWVPDLLGGGDGTVGENEDFPEAGTFGPDDVFEWKIINVVGSPIEQGHEEIVMAHYAPGKKAQANPGTLLKIREIAQARVREADSITVIGVHLPTDPAEDPFLWKLLNSMSELAKREQCRVRYMSPTAEEVRRAQGELGFTAQASPFKAYVEELERTRSASTP